MSSKFDDARDSIELKLTLKVLLGYLEEDIAVVWRNAIRQLDDTDIAHLTRLTQNCPDYKVSSVLLKYLMNKNYPFRELILYRTDEAFKRRLGIKETYRGGY